MGYDYCYSLFSKYTFGQNIHVYITLPYSDKRKQLFKMTFPVNEQNVSVVYIDINAISLYLDLNISQQDECFCFKLGMGVEYAKSSLKTSLSQIWVICRLLPFVRVGQNRPLICVPRVLTKPVSHHYIIFHDIDRPPNWDDNKRRHINSF